jgi:hypothetical protein
MQDMRHELELNRELLSSKKEHLAKAMPPLEALGDARVSFLIPAIKDNGPW